MDDRTRAAVDPALRAPADRAPPPDLKEQVRRRTTDESACTPGTDPGMLITVG